MSRTAKVNEHGVFHDPETIYELRPEFQTWSTIQVVIANYRKKWYSGYHSFNGASPCSIKGTAYPDRDSAIESAIKSIDESVHERLDNTPQTKQAIKSFLLWSRTRNQLQLF